MGLIGTISVTPELLIEKGTELQGVVKTLVTQFEEVKNIVNSSGSYWIGEGGDKLRKQYTETHTEVAEVLARWEEYPIELQKMAGVYTDRDRIAIEKAQELPGDVLE